MPYEVKGNCVYKRDGGAKVGCTKGDVNKYLGALHANANESIIENEEPLDAVKQAINAGKMPDVSFDGKESNEGNKISILGKSVEDSYELYDRLHKWLLDRKIAHKIGTRKRLEHSDPEQSKKAMTIYAPSGSNFERLLSLVGDMVKGYEGWKDVKGTPFNGYERYSDGVYFRNDRDESGNYIPAKNAKNPNNTNDNNTNDMNENTLIGGVADNLSVPDIANKFGVGTGEIQSQINKGIGVEMEHTNDKIKATEIATDHVSEIPDYYDRLEKMEREAFKHFATNTSSVSTTTTSVSPMFENTKALIKRLLHEKLY